MLAHTLSPIPRAPTYGRPSAHKGPERAARVGQRDHAKIGVLALVDTCRSMRHRAHIHPILRAGGVQREKDIAIAHQAHRSHENSPQLHVSR